MADPAVLIAVDQGTSSTKTIVVGADGAVRTARAVALDVEHPAPGHVQQDAAAILGSVHEALAAARELAPGPVAALGLSSQRESAVVWSRRTGEALGPVLGWQDRRTAERARTLAAHDDDIRRITGLPLDPMFSALKFAHLLDEIDPDRRRSRSGEIALGTVDSFLIARLTGEHRIEIGNASRTQLLDLASGAWSEEMLDLFDIPAEALPRIAESDEPTGAVDRVAGAAVMAVLGDSHAALFGHGAREAGSVKVTYGTGSSIMGLEPEDGAPVPGLVRTIAWRAAGRTALAFEGNILSTGATLVWLADVLGTTPAHLVELARDAGPGPVDLVPAFSGLGAPWWDEGATAVLSGFELGSSRAALARAAVESIALQVEDVLVAAESAGRPLTTVLADGGPSSNDWVMQLQADLSGRTVVRSSVPELSAVGVAHLAGITAGVWDEAAVRSLPRATASFAPVIPPEDAAARRTRWLTALARARSGGSATPADSERRPVQDDPVRSRARN